MRDILEEESELGIGSEDLSEIEASTKKGRILRKLLLSPVSLISALLGGIFGWFLSMWPSEDGGYPYSASAMVAGALAPARSGKIGATVLMFFLGALAVLCCALALGFPAEESESVAEYGVYSSSNEGRGFAMKSQA